MIKALVALAALGLAAHWAHRCSADELPLRWEIPTPGLLPQAVAIDQRDSKFLYVAVKTGGISIFSNSSDQPQKIAEIPKQRLGAMDAMNLFLQEDLQFVALGDFFPAQNHAGLAIINIRVPSRPVVLSVWKSPQKLKGSAVVVANETKAFLGGMHHGVLTFDIRNKSQVRHVSTFQPDIHFPNRNPNKIQRPNARGMALRGKLLYVTYDAGGLRILNVSGDSPSEIGRYINPAMAGKQQAYNNILLDGRRAFIGIDYAGLEIVDISNPRKIKQIGWWNPWQAGTLKNLWVNSPGHGNQVGFDPAKQHVYLSAGDSELQVIDVSKSSDPQLSHWYGKPKNGQGVWGVAVDSDTAYLTYIKAIVPFRGNWSGIRAVDIEQ